MSNREQFEAWWKSEGYDEKLSCVQGIMFNHIKANMFFAWQSATCSMEARCSALAAENAGLKAANEEGCRWDGEQWVGLYNETPATDAFLAEVRAQGVEMLAENHQNVVDALNGDSLFADGERRHAAIAAAAVYFAAQLRKGVQS